MIKVNVLGKQEIFGVEFTLYGTVLEPLFLASEVAEVIDYNKNRKGQYNVGQMLELVDDDEKVMLYCTISNMSYEHTPVIATGVAPSNRLFLTEFGIYELLFRSRKPKAKEFKKQVKEILRDIRLEQEEVYRNVCGMKFMTNLELVSYLRATGNDITSRELNMELSTHKLIHYPYRTSSNTGKAYVTDYAVYEQYGKYDFSGTWKWNKEKVIKTLNI